MTLPPSDPADAVARLTAKERECLERWMDHATAKEIALDLDISHHAVEKRLKSARQKLGVATSLEAARLLAEVEGYGRTASRPSEVASSADEEHHGSAGGAVVSQPPLLRRRLWIIGASIMSIIAIAAVALAPLATDSAAEQPEVFVVDKDKDRAAIFDLAANQTFTRLDKDGSGHLEAGELSNASIRTLHVDPKTQAAPTREMVKVADADTDDDGRVSRDEYRAWFGNFTTDSRS